MECNGVLYPVGIKHQKAKEDYSVCYFAILFKNKNDIKIFRSRTEIGEL